MTCCSIRQIIVRQLSDTDLVNLSKVSSRFWRLPSSDLSPSHGRWCRDRQRPPRTLTLEEEVAPQRYVFQRAAAAFELCAPAPRLIPSYRAVGFLHSYEASELWKDARRVTALLARVKPLLLAEPNVLQVAPPVCIVGKIHAHYEELVTVFQLRGFPDEQSYLFLGDYINRGADGVKVRAIRVASADSVRVR